MDQHNITKSEHPEQGLCFRCPYSLETAPFNLYFPRSMAYILYPLQGVVCEAPEPTIQQPLTLTAMSAIDKQHMWPMLTAERNIRYDVSNSQPVDSNPACITTN